MERQPLETQTLFAELLDRLTAHEAARAIGHVAGTFTTKTIKGRDYFYFQHSEPGGTKRQTYVGPKDAALDAFVERYAAAREAVEPDERSIERLSALLRVGGLMTTDTASARVLRAFADAGVFRLGGVLVGTHAFIVLGNLLGVRWTGATFRTQDVDVAADRALGLVVPTDAADVPGVLDGLEMGFLPVPALDHASPSTSFKVRGHGLRVDLLTPTQGPAGKPVPLPRFAAAAQPLRYLDMLTEGTVRAAVVNGGAVSVVVPDPARFALHKLIISGERPVAGAAKREKDLVQAANLLDVLLEDRAGDIALAREAVEDRGRAWTGRLERGLQAMRSVSPGVAERAASLIG
jgi:hypothetical protein